MPNVEIAENKLKEVGIKIKELRIKQGYTSYEQFAIEHNLSRMYYWKVEKGQNITLAYLFKLLDIFKVSPQDFFKDMQ